jgi:hypothetical protein
MTESITVSFRNVDSELLEFLKDRIGNPPKFTGVHIRECLYAFMETQDVLLDKMDAGQ